MTAVGAPAVLVAAAIAVALLWSTGAMGRGDTVTPPGVLEFPADGELEGGRTYRFADGSWLIDVPEGMRLSPNPPKCRVEGAVSREAVV